MSSSATTPSSFLLFCQASAGEMNLWERLLPVAVERARQTYAHSVECLYNGNGNTGNSLRTLCNCGKGKDLPLTFVKTMSSADSAQPTWHSLMYRAAFSPVYRPTEMWWQTPAYISPAKNIGMIRNRVTARSTRCAKCGREGRLMRCARCRVVYYCSKECQRKDWEHHRRACA